MTLREQYEITESTILSKYACTSMNEDMTRRAVPEEKCPYRTDFQRDRDRILHCNSFRRLKRKTQVFLSPIGDHYRTRLTHTLEVSQIARTICPYGFKHYLQSVRVAETLENNGTGLNLTKAVLNGIECHTNMTADTREGCVVRLADTIAYINHDIEDSIRAGVLSIADLPADCVKILGNTKSQRITTLIASVLAHGVYEIDFEPEIRKAHDELRAFMFKKVYTNPDAKQEDIKAELLIKKLYKYFKENVEKLPEQYRKIAEITDTDRAVCDYIAGMSDGYAVDLYTELFVPKFWK